VIYPPAEERRRRCWRTHRTDADELVREAVDGFLAR